MDPDLEAGLGLDQSRPGVSRGTQRWIKSNPRWIWVDQVEPESTKWIGPRYNFPMTLGFINIKMFYQRVVVMSVDKLFLDDFWDKRLPLIVKYSIHLFIAVFQPFYPNFSSLNVWFLQLWRPRPHATNVCLVKRFIYKLGLECIPKLIQPREDSCFIYEDLIKKGEVACQKSKNTGQQLL